MAEKTISFTSYDGYKLEGTLQQAVKERAALLFVHGITSSRDELGFHSDYAKYLAQHGVTSLRFDYRFHGVNESSLQELTLCGIVNDIEAAFNALSANVKSSTRRYFIVGTSFGGGLAAYWVDVAKKDKVKKVFLNAPVLNYENDVLERNKLLSKDQLAPAAARQLAKKGFVKSSDIRFGRGLINELRYVNGIQALKKLGERVVIFHGDEDEDVPLASSKKYRTPKTRLEIVKGVGHGFGIEIDEDLTHPETKKIHQSIYKKALSILEASL
jgi:pimeloyl-ACP methyl ester carboxylesterase